MCGAPTKPKRNRTAELAFKVDEVSTVSSAPRNSCVHSHIRTFGTNQLFWLEVLLFVFRVTGLHPAEIRVLALET